jgi:hypothetical protein
MSNFKRVLTRLTEGNNEPTGSWSKDRQHFFFKGMSYVKDGGKWFTGEGRELKSNFDDIEAAFQEQEKDRKQELSKKKKLKEGKSPSQHQIDDVAERIKSTLSATSMNFEDAWEEFENVIERYGVTKEQVKKAMKNPNLKGQYDN